MDNNDEWNNIEVPTNNQVEFGIKTPPLVLLLPDLPGYHVLVRPISVKSKTKGGVFIPDSTRDDMSYLTTVGQVLALGDLAYHEKEKFPSGAWCTVGDYVCYGKHTGTKMFYKGVRLILLFDDQIIMRVRS